jgi:predicted Zn finger-like uncharacterized protein
MIVECESCHAKFKLDDSRVTEKGIKVRCSKCKFIFTVRKSPPAEEEFAVGKGPERELRFDEEELARFAEDTGTKAAEAISEQEAYEPTIKIDLSDQKTIPFEEEEAFPKEEVIKKGPKKKAISAPVLVGAIIGVIICIAVVAYFYILPYFMGPQETMTSNLTISNLKAYYEQNVQVPKIYVIQGVVTNESKKSRRYIQVKGVLFDSKGKPVKQQLAYCGNLIPKADLKTKSPEFIQKAMGTISGLKGENNLVKPRSSIPFMIVFFSLPQEMTEYSVEIASSQLVQ